MPNSRNISGGNIKPSLPYTYDEDMSVSDRHIPEEVGKGKMKKSQVYHDVREESIKMNCNTESIRLNDLEVYLNNSSRNNISPSASLEEPKKSASAKINSPL